MVSILHLLVNTNICEPPPPPLTQHVWTIPDYGENSDENELATSGT